MTNPTTNFGWVMPTATDLVTDLPADFNVFGQGVDTSMADLLGGTTGQILAKASATNMDFTWTTPNPGDITAVNVTSPITGGGTSGDVTIAIQDALTTQKGAVQLSDSTSTTSSILAATPTAVKSAYDLATAAIAKSTVTTAGDIIYRNATVPTRLGIGTASQVLRVNSGATAPEWATMASGATGWTLLNAGGTALTGASTITISSISAKQIMVGVLNASSTVASAAMYIRPNSLTTAIYDVFGNSGNASSAYSAQTIFDRTALYQFSTGIPIGNMPNAVTGILAAYTFIDKTDQTGFKNFTSSGTGADNSGSSSGQVMYNNGGILEMSAAVTSLTIATTSGNFDAGTIYVWGAN